jgi:hypothetical protein
MKLMLAIMLLLALSSAVADVDMACLNHCLNSGQGGYGYCKAICTY